MGDRLIVTILTLTLTLTRLLRVTRDPQAEDLKAQQVVYPSVTEEEYDTLVKESEAVEKKWKLFRKCAYNSILVTSQNEASSTLLISELHRPISYTVTGLAVSPLVRFCTTTLPARGSRLKRVTSLSSVPSGTKSVPSIMLAKLTGKDTTSGRVRPPPKLAPCSASFSTMRRQKGPSTSSEPFGIFTPYARVSSVSSPP